jgi:predicted Fe-Mo cluster-binding NifX family protein
MKEEVPMKKVISIILAILFMASGFAFAGEKEKIAVAANDKTPTASVSKQAGPSPFFLIFDGKGKLIETIANPAKDSQNSGIAVADFLAGKGATVVVAEGFGPKIVEVMKGKGIKAVSFKGSAEEAVKKVLQAN